MNRPRNIVFLFAITLINISCSFFGRTNIVLVVKNGSNSFIDSAIFKINGYKENIARININVEKQIDVPRNLIPNNKHDITVFVTVFLRGGKTLSAQFYNDLTGSAGKSITAVVDSNLQLILKPEW